MKNLAAAAATVKSAAIAVAEPLNFAVLKRAVAEQFELMKPYPLYRVDLSDGKGSPEQRAATGNKLWETYLASFPAGSNPIYRERTEHDCQCCRLPL